MNWIRFEGSPCRTVPAPLASQPLAGAPLVVCRREHSPPPCGGQGARDEDLGRKPVGKKCNRKGNLCKKAHGTADSSMAAGLWNELRYDLESPLWVSVLPPPWLACPPLRPASAASSGFCEKLRFSSGTLCPPLRPAVAASSRFCEKLRFEPGTLCPPLRPASAASRRFCEKLRFSSGTALPPMLAIWRCRSAFIEANPRFDVRPSEVRPS